MEILWKRGAASVNDVVDALPKDKPAAYNTVLTVLRILERKGYLEHTKDGRAFIYRPVVDQGQARRTAVRHLLARFFDDSPELLVQNLLRDEEMDDRELERLRKLIGSE